LARNAYPRTPKDVLETYIKRQFSIGLHVQAVRDQLLLYDNDDIKNADILTKAVELQNKLFSVNTYTNNNSPNNSNYSNNNNKSNENRIQNQQQLNQKPDPSIQSHHTDTGQ
jgi:hypothetical protein